MLSGLTNNKTELDWGIGARHNGIDDEYCGVSCNSNTIPLLKTSSTFDRYFTETVLQRGESQNDDLRRLCVR